MGFFDSLFGRKEKLNFGELIPDPPVFRLAPGSTEALTGGIEDLISTYQRRSTGQDQFDFIRFLFEPQLNRLNQAYGIQAGGQPLGPLGRRQGALGRLEADLQRRGLFDTGSSGVLQAQLEADRAAKEADLFGEAKIAQRADIDAALSNLSQLFPARFQAQNIQSEIDYQNAVNQQDRQIQRNLATAQQRQTRPSGFASVLPTLFNVGLNLAAPGSGSAISAIGNLFNRGGASSGGRFTDILTGPGGQPFRPSTPPIGMTFGLSNTI